jgi:hypothetical protein
MRRLLDTSQRSRLQFRPHHLCESMTAEQHFTQKAAASGCEADWGLCTLCEADLGASSHVALFRPNAQRESIGLHSSLRPRVEHGIDRLPYGGRCVL